MKRKRGAPSEVEVGVGNGPYYILPPTPTIAGWVAGVGGTRIPYNNLKEGPGPPQL